MAFIKPDTILAEEEPWEREQAKRFVNYHFNISCLNLFPLGDLHYGDPACDVDLLHKTINDIKCLNGRVILMGDLLENANRESVGAGVYHQESNPMDQFKEMIGILDPIKHLIIGSLLGNHEDRTFQDSGFNISELLARELKVPYLGWGGYFFIEVGTQMYSIFATHGSAGSRFPEGKLKACKQVGANKMVDLVLMGHVHDILHDFEKIEVPTEDYLGVKYIEKHYVTTGHFMGLYNGEAYYAKKNMPATKVGCPIVNLFGEVKKIEVKV